MDKQKKRKASMDNVEKAMYREKQHYVERILAPAVEDMKRKEAPK